MKRLEFVLAFGLALAAVSSARALDRVDWLVSNEPELSQLRAEAERLSAPAGALAAAQEEPARELQACDGAGDVRHCLRDRYALRIAALRSRLPAERSRPGAVSMGPFALNCPGLPGDRSVTYLNTAGGSVVLTSPQGRRVLDLLVSASGERYGVWTAEGELVLWGKGGSYLLKMPGAATEACALVSD